MIMNEKLNDTDQKILLEEAVHIQKRSRKSTNTMGSTNSPFENFHGEKPNIIGSFSWFGRITYVTKWGKLKKEMEDNTEKAIMVGYTDNHTRDTNKLYNTDTKRVITTRDVNWEDCKMTYPAETPKMFRNTHEEDFVPGIEEVNINTS